MFKKLHQHLCTKLECSRCSLANQRPQHGGQETQDNGLVHTKNAPNHNSRGRILTGIKNKPRGVGRGYASYQHTLVGSETRNLYNALVRR